MTSKIFIRFNETGWLKLNVFQLILILSLSFKISPVAIAIFIPLKTTESPIQKKQDKLRNNFTLEPEINK